MNEIYNSRLAFSALDKAATLSELTELQNLFLVNALSDCSRVLDLGVGFGNVAKALLMDDKTVTGVDISRIGLNYAVEKTKPCTHILLEKILGREGRRDFGKLSLIQGDFRRLPFNSEFDGVSCASNIGAKDAGLVLPEVYRALRKGGYFAVTVLEDPKLAAERTNKEMEKKGINYVLSNFTKDELEFLRGIEGRTFGDELQASELMRLAKKCGFETKSVVPFYDDAFYCLVVRKVV